MDIKGKKILIVGFGRSGKAAARYCVERGGVVTVTDSRPESAFMKEDGGTGRMEATNFQLPPSSLLPPAGSSVTYHFGSHPSHLFESADIIIPSPGVPLSLEGIRLALRSGKSVIGEMELALDEIRAPIIAITGTNGKSTVTTLIGEILKEAGEKVLVGGNLGTPLIELLQTSNSELRTPNYIVLEISSYQLEISPNLHPKVGVLLNITPDHLDRYENYGEYISAKAMINKNLTKNDFLIYNESDELVRKIAEASKAKIVPFSLQKKVGSKDIDLSRALITGAHNQENMMAALLAVTSLGVEPKHAQRVFERFKGLPHRNQFVREVNNVRYYDDSKGTNVGAVVKSLEGFSEKVVLIAGGLDKGGSYDPLKTVVKEKVKAMVLIGASKAKIAGEFKDITRTVLCDSMAEAVKEASKLANKGDVVLLSPACASFDMFRDYGHRGDVFAEEVMKL